jgi:acyl transferase domain-containing protein
MRAKRGAKMSRRKLSNSQRGVAIIGMSGRFPGAENLAEFWENLRASTESISFYSVEELADSGVDPSALDDPHFVPAGSILKDIDLFDASFFGFTPREAESLDPQKRLFLECSWHALEDAGYDPGRYPGAIGVYAGCAMSTYLYELEQNKQLADVLGLLQVLIGNDKDYLTTLVSYKLDLRGPSLSIQTTCSTSLVAVCVACQALLNGQCDMALAGGVCVRTPQKTGYYYEPGGIYSPDGHCRVFDARGQGIVFGSGAGVVVLKRLSDAISDRDAIHAVIRGTAINNDGASKTSYTAPGLEGQAEVIARAHWVAGVKPQDITYVEAHGTATPVGDPIEIAALTKAFGVGRTKKNSCAVGSVKTNFGHLDHAAGIAGLIKTVLSLEHKMIPPSLHFETANPMIDFAQGPFYVNTRLTKWTSKSSPRRAGVSAFGIGGTNAHVVLEEAPPLRSRASLRPAQLLLISAKSRSALENATARLTEYLDQNPRLNLADVAYTTQVGRRAFTHRRMVVAGSAAEVVSALRAAGPHRVYTAEQPVANRPVIFMFSGQGAQYVNMAAELYDVESTFRKHFDHCADLLLSRFKLDLFRAVYSRSDEKETASEALRQTMITQPALFAVEYALAQLWMEWGIHPRAMIGHSIGEYVAACLAGVLSVEDSLLLVAERGRMMQELPSGSMLALSLPEAELRAVVGDRLSIAAVNEASLCVVSGPTEDIERLATDLANNGVVGRPLHTSHAFHSGMMDPMLAEFARLVQSVRLSAPQIPYVSNVTGTWIAASQATDPDYWVRHLRGTVRFADGLDTLLKEANCVLLEIGPGQALSTFARRHPAKTGDQLVLSSLRHPHERQSDCEFILTALGKQWLAGVEVDWSGVHCHERRCRLHLPTYSFDRQRYWAGSAAVESPRPDLVKKPDISDWFYVPSWKYTVSPNKAEPSEPSPRRGNWLVFTDTHLGPSLARLIEAQGYPVVRVTPGAGFVQHEGDYEIDPTDPRHYAALLRDLQAANRFPDHIAHLWGVSNDESTPEAASFDRHQQLGLYSLLLTARAIIALDAAAEIDIGVVTNGLHAVTGEEKLSPGKATILGACKAIPQEYPGLRCRSIDIVLPATDGAYEERLAPEVLSELGTESRDTIVAYREGQRWVQFFEPVRLTESAESTPLLREGGVYLITGGLGNIGLALAEELARSVRARIVLIGRSGLPPRGKWTDWVLNHDHDDPTCHRIRKVQAIESLGSEVLVFSADVADEEALRRVVDRSCALFGEIHGVIHAAGTIAPDAFTGIDQVDAALCERHFRPKVRGLLALEKVLRGRALDFWLVISSLSSVLAGLGFVAYAAANIFLDAFAAAHNWVDGSTWISVNWDAWDFQDGADDDADSVPSALTMLSREGVETFRRILSWGSLQQVVISASDLQVRVDQWITPQAFRKAPQNDDGHAVALHARPNLLSPYVAPRNKLEQNIAEVWQEILGIGQVGVHDNFFTELGGSSLLATQLVARLRGRLHIDLPVRRFFEGATVGELALAIQSNGKESTAEMPEARAEPPSA